MHLISCYMFRPMFACIVFMFFLFLLFLYFFNYFFFFFFSSRRRHTRSKRDWSSDVCSSDLPVLRELFQIFERSTLGIKAPRACFARISEKAREGQVA